ncbi:hypothetical protein KC19_2G186200 [Ceratodon purpureus]|uniref:Uncharacterized protein n=1 Tax=Ceratodon purpureus TaxID=3225 RepID=A0A8T0IZC3_CERPU|nr:hypothetical protein KC19_2G186200 [Ceratodon purpureus]
MFFGYIILCYFGFEYSTSSQRSYRAWVRVGDLGRRLWRRSWRIFGVVVFCWGVCCVVILSWRHGPHFSFDSNSFAMYCWELTRANYLKKLGMCLNTWNSYEVPLVQVWRELLYQTQSCS